MIQVFLQWLKNILDMGKKKDVKFERKRGMGMAALVTKRLDIRTRRLKPVPTVRLRLDDLMEEHPVANRADVGPERPAPLLHRGHESCFA